MGPWTYVTWTFVLGLGDLAERIVLLTPLLDAVSELHDLEHVDDVDREEDRQESDRRGEQRPPGMPDAVGAEGDEAGRECRGSQGGAPGPDRHRRPALREATPQEAD